MMNPYLQFQYHRKQNTYTDRMGLFFSFSIAFLLTQPAYNRMAPYQPPSNVSPQDQQLYIQGSQVFRRSDTQMDGNLDRNEFVGVCQQIGFRYDRMFNFLFINLD